jgi:hypothetical protein
MLNTIRVNPGVDTDGIPNTWIKWRHSAASTTSGAPSARRYAEGTDWLEYDVP